MTLSELCIRRPVLTIVFNLVIILFGGIGLNYLGVREFPSTDRPVISVTTNYTGANAEVIESQITEPLEEYISGIDGVSQITSTSREERSTITIEFELSVDLNDAANNVIEKVTRSARYLPPDTDSPIVAKEDGNSSPIIFLNIKSAKRTPLELTEIADKTFKQRVQTIKGVSLVPIWGSKLYSMRLWLERELMASQGVTPGDVQAAIQRENVELPSGRVEGNSTELSVRTLGRLETVSDFNNLPVKQDGLRTIRLRDIGYAILDAENQRTVLKRDGISMVGIAIIPQPGANFLDIANEFYDRVNDIKRGLPDDIEVGVGFDNTRYIQQAVDEVSETIFIAFILVVLIIFLFLRDWRTTLIPVLAIPISLIGSFFVMYVAGFSINILTLLAMVLSIGIVVDDAIVMMENIYSRVEKGEDGFLAAIAGSKEVFFAVIATTLSLVVVFLPVIFIGGLVGRLFFEFGIVLAFTVMISSFVALTLTPMVSSRLLKPVNKANWFYTKTESFYVSLNREYASGLDYFLKRVWLAPVILLVSAGLIYVFNSNLEEELAPLEDRNNLSMFTQAQEGATYEYMERYMDGLVRLVMTTIPEEEREAVISVTSPGFSATSSVNSGFVRLILKDASGRKRSAAEIKGQLFGMVSQLSGARTFVMQPQTIGGRFNSKPIEFVLKAPNNEELRKVIGPFMEQARKDPAFSFVDINLKLDKPELTVVPDRQKAQDLGVSIRDISQSLQLAFSGSRYGYFIKNGKQYQIIGQLKRTDRNDPRDLRSLYVRNNQGEMVQLDNVVKTEENTTTPALFRFERYPSATISAQLNDGYTQGAGIEAMQKIADGVLPETFQTALSGSSKDLEDSNSSILFSILLAAVLVFLVLAGQFESFRDPLIIILNIITALAGALFCLWAFEETLNIFSKIGIIMLIGLVTKNGILIVEFANQLKEQGMDKRDAVRQAAISRFRPILMTTASTVFGFLPIALALGAGAESRTSMGIAVAGGVLISSILSVYIVPGMYLIISSNKKKGVEHA